MLEIRFYTKTRTGTPPKTAFPVIIKKTKDKGKLTKWIEFDLHKRSWTIRSVSLACNATSKTTKTGNWL